MKVFRKMGGWSFALTCGEISRLFSAQQFSPSTLFLFPPRHPLCLRIDFVQYINSLSFSAKLYRFLIALISFTLNPSKRSPLQQFSTSKGCASMPLLRSSKYTCFYCNRRSNQAKVQGLRQWHCDNCGSDNFLDEVSLNNLLPSQQY